MNGVRETERTDERTNECDSLGLFSANRRETKTFDNSCANLIIFGQNQANLRMERNQKFQLPLY